MKARTLGIITVVASVIAATFGTAASAHVVVKPSDAATASFYTFTVGVPNEKDIPVMGLRLVIPAGLRHISPTQKAGWEVSLEKEGEGAGATVTAIEWTGGTIAPELRDEFTFSAQTPDVAGDLLWKAYQTYEDGTVVAWDQAVEGGHGSSDISGPYSVTKVAADSNGEQSLEEVSQKADRATSAAQTAFYVGVGGIVVGLMAVFVATRRR